MPVANPYYDQSTIKSQVAKMTCH